MTEKPADTRDADRPDAAGGDPDPATIPADQTVGDLGDVQIGGETEEDSPSGGLAEP